MAEQVTGIERELYIRVREREEERAKMSSDPKVRRMSDRQTDPQRKSQSQLTQVMTKTLW